MAKQTTKSAGGRTKRQEQDSAEITAWKKEHEFEYVNIPLGEDEKDEIALNPITPERLMRMIEDLAFNRYKFGVSYDAQHNCYVVSITGVRVFREDYNLCVTSRHSLMPTALAIAEYKWERFIKAGAIARGAAKDTEIFD